MMHSIVYFSLKQKIFFNLIFVLLTIAGFFAFFSMPTERFPNVNFGEVVITTHYPGASPVEIETLITRKLEKSLETIENVEWLNSTSYPERSHIRIKFIDDSDYDFLFNEVRLNVLSMMGELPDEIDPPIIKKVVIDDLIPVVYVNLGSDEHSNRALSLMADTLKNKLQKLNGVKEIRLEGEYLREFHIYLDPDKLRQTGISFSEVSSVLQSVNVSIPSGRFKTHSGNYLIKVDEKFHQHDQLVKTIIRRVGDGGFIRLEDLISSAELSYRDPVIISTVNGKKVVSLQVIKTEAGNALNIKKQVVESLKSFQAMFDREALEVTLTRDSTVKIKDGLTTLSLNLLAGMFLVSLIIWYFMGWRNASLVTIGIPFAFMMTTLLMYLTDNSLNELSLFAFVLVSGIIVDDAIVVTENIYRHISAGKNVNQAIVIGTSEVALPVISSTLTTIAAFVPMLIMSGATGEFFAQIPTAVTYALIASLVECLIILPVHYQHFGPRATDKLPPRLKKDNKLIAITQKLTFKTLAFTLNYRRLTVFFSFVLLMLSIGILLLSLTGKMSLLKIQFFPDDYSVYYADIKGPSETSINIIDAKLREMAGVIMSDGPGVVESSVAIAGFYVNDAYEPVYGNNFGTILVTLPAKDKQSFADPQEYLQQIRKKLKLSFEKDGYVLDIHAQKDGPRTGKPVSIRILGSNISSIEKLADKLSHFLRNDPQISPWLISFEDDRGLPKRIYRFDIRHERVSEYDLNSGEVARLAGSVLDGQYIGKYRLVDEEIDLKLFIDPQTLNGLQDALSIPFLEHSSHPILLGDVSRLRTYTEQGELHRYQGQRSISLKADLIPDATISAAFILNAIQQYYQQIQADYPGAMLSIGGDQESTQRSFQSLLVAFALAIMVIYIILAAQFQSYMQPVIILAAVVFALIGVILGKFFTQSLFTINSFMAIIGVAGVVVNDSLMLVDFMNKSYQQKKSRLLAIHKAISIRVRPIILTTLTTTLGLLPMALGLPDYSIVWGAMASTFVAGLAVATLLTLVVIPVLWDLVQERQERKDLKKNKTCT